MSDMQVLCCDPRERAGEIKDLFVRDGHSAFDAFFERVYRARADERLRSWLALVDGRVVAHVSVSPVEFTDGSQTRIGGILGDLHASEKYRDFWTPVRVLRTMVADTKREGWLDFLLTTTIPDAEAVFKAGGFGLFGRLRRFVLPLIGPYLAVSQVRALTRAKAADSNPLDADQMQRLLPTLGCGGLFRPSAGARFYSTRIPREDYADGTWIALGERADAGCRTKWSLLGRHSTLPEIGIADAFWGSDERGFEEVVLSAARWAKSKGFSRLTVSTLDETGVATRLLRCGFFARSVRAAVLLQPLREPAPPSLNRWFLTGLSLSGW